MDQFKKVLNERKGEEVEVLVDRGGKVISLNLEVDTNGQVGFSPDIMAIFEGKMDTTRFGFFESFGAGWRESISMLGTQVAAFSGMADGKIAVSKSVMGPIQMAGIYGDTWDPQRFWKITAILSLILAVMNLLPIPALDGGHVVFLIYEMIAGKPVSDRFMYVTQVIGMVILLTLMLFIFGNDIIQTVFK
jgi:regulator of sigma E protease